MICLPPGTLVNLVARDYGICWIGLCNLTAYTLAMLEPTCWQVAHCIYVNWDVSGIRTSADVVVIAGVHVMYTLRSANQ